MKKVLIYLVGIICFGIVSLFIKTTVTLAMTNTITVGYAIFGSISTVITLLAIIGILSQINTDKKNDTKKGKIIKLFK